MNSVLKSLPILSIASLIAIFILALALFGGGIERSVMNNWMLIASIVWFVTAPLWIGKRKE
jgi:hypothetical protein